MTEEADAAYRAWLCEILDAAAVARLLKRAELDDHPGLVPALHHLAGHLR
ncbi:hypothetical protein BTM25_34480 [Actinomadura rubteroloni]|uniref:Uncharacterized protein n=1 Tax=Actinomadura rubteroloni TaxID=1926885 RepID=A0A2P4UID7_9ACTN|nr:hypothetical protein [Actinomadura rubteroloni]POM24810.1 hypothetical protein BTM25_34480 [Actinomadura rubteroloni]